MQIQDHGGVPGKQVHLGTDSKQGSEGRASPLCSSLPGEAAVSFPDARSKQRLMLEISDARGRIPVARGNYLEVIYPCTTIWGWVFLAHCMSRYCPKSDRYMFSHAFHVLDTCQASVLNMTKRSFSQRNQISLPLLKPRSGSHFTWHKHQWPCSGYQGQTICFSASCSPPSFISSSFLSSP